MKLAYRSQTHLNTEQRAGDFLPAAAGDSVASGEIHQQGCEPRAEAGSRMGWNLGPGRLTASTSDRAKVVFGNMSFDLGNVDDLVTEILAQQLTVVFVRLKRAMASLTIQEEYPLPRRPVRSVSTPGCVPCDPAVLPAYVFSISWAASALAWWRDHRKKEAGRNCSNPWSAQLPCVPTPLFWH